MNLLTKVTLISVASGMALLVSIPAKAQGKPGETVASVSLPEGELKNINFDLAAFGQIGLSNQVDIPYDDSKDRFLGKEYGGEVRLSIPVSSHITIGARASYTHRDIRREATGTVTLTGFPGGDREADFFDRAAFRETRWEGNFIAQYHREDNSEVVSASVGVSSEESSYSSGSSGFGAPCCSYDSWQENTDLTLAVGYERQVSSRARLGVAGSIAVPLQFEWGFASYRGPPYPYNTNFSTSERKYALGGFVTYRMSDDIRLRFDAEVKRFLNGSVYTDIGVQATLWKSFSIGPVASFRLQARDSQKGENTTFDSLQSETSTFFGLRAKIRIGGHL